jgi:hypothetical protein
LSSGQFAIIETLSSDGGLGFSLVPWQPVLDKRVGQHISGLMRSGGDIEWSFGRKGGWGCESKIGPCLFGPSRPDQRHPVKAGGFRVTASRLAALTGCRRPGKGLPSR